MSHPKRKSGSPAAHAEPVDDRATTVRTTPIDADLDSLPDQASLYVGPQLTPKPSDHKTIDMVPVRLAPEVDPRRAATRKLETVRTEGTNVWLIASALGLLFFVATLVLVTRSGFVRRQAGAVRGVATQQAKPEVPAALLLAPAPSAASEGGLATQKNY